MQRGWRGKVAALVLAVMLPLSVCGCGVVIVAGLGALGGYAVSRDTIEGVTGYSAQELFAASSEILSIMGTVSEQSKADGHVVATVDGAKVTVDTIPMSKNSTKLRVKARRGMLPKVAIAQDVYMKIVRKLQE
jgi:hypothetical protein